MFEIQAAGEVLRKWKTFITWIYYGLLRDITDITGLFLNYLLTLDQDPEKSSLTLIFEENKENSAQFITEYYRTLRSVISHPP